MFYYSKKEEILSNFIHAYPVCDNKNQFTFILTKCGPTIMKRIRDPMRTFRKKLI